MRLCDLAWISVVTGILCGSVLGQSSIIDFDPATASFDESHENTMIGWTFHVNSTITINQIGWYDQGLDGLSRSFNVGLWQDLSGNYFSPSSTPVALLGNSGMTIPG